MNESTASEAAERPVTGNAAVDAALAEFGSLADHRADDHHEALAGVADVLAAVLENSREAIQTPIPGVRPGHGG